MDKEQIVQAILERLRVDFETHQTTSKMTRAASNDSETKSEGKYDTRSTEGNYFADGLAKKALATAHAHANTPAVRAHRRIAASDVLKEILLISCSRRSIAIRCNSPVATSTRVRKSAACFAVVSALPIV
jgi:hypothetical protein